MSYVYVVSQEGGGQPWKIGRTTDPAARLKSLQTGSPVPLSYVKIVEAHPTLESSLHRQFAKYRTNGEWFDLSPEMASEVLERLDGKMLVMQLPANPKKKSRHHGHPHNGTRSQRSRKRANVKR